MEQPTSAADHAVQLIEQGFAVIPIATGTKKPVMKNWTTATPVTDPAMARKFLGNPGTHNYGIIMPPDADQTVIVLDLDDGDGATERWQDRMRALIKEIGPLPPTRWHQTPSGGRHVFFIWPGKTPPKGDTFLGFTMRVLNKRHQVVGPGSEVDGKPYSVGNGVAALAELPSEWVQAFKASVKAPTATIRQQVEPNGALITVSSAVEGYELPIRVGAGGRYSAIRDYIASRWNRGVTDEELWAGVQQVLAPRFDVALTETELRERFDRARSGMEARLGSKAADRDVEQGVHIEVSAPKSTEADTDTAPVALPTDEIELLALPTSEFPGALPEEAYNDTAGMVVADLATQTVASREGLLASVLAYAGSVLGVHAIYHGKKPSNSFVALVGDSAVGKKTTTMRAVMDAMQDDRVFGRQDLARVDGLGSGEGIIGTVRRRVDKAGGFWSGAIISSEMGGQLKIAAREGSILSTVIRQGYDGDAIANITKGSDIEVAGWEYQLGSLVGITPDELRDLLASGSEIANGFANRYVWVPVRQRDVKVAGTVAFRIGDGAAVMLKAALAHAVANRFSPMEIEEGGLRLLNGYYSFLQTIRADGGLSRRLSDAALRFALTRAALAGHDSVTRMDVKRSIYLTEYARQGLGWVFGAIAASEDASTVAEALHAVGGSLNLSQIGPVAFKSKGAGHRVDKALKELRSLGMIESSLKSGTGGRSATVIRLVFSPSPSSRARADTDTGYHPWQNLRDKGKSVQGGGEKVGETEGEVSSAWEEAQRIFAEDV